LSPSRPIVLSENAGLAFIGEELWPPAGLRARQTKSFEEVRNPTSRPNADVIRRFIGVESGNIKKHVQIDFPLHFTEQEAGLYLKPFSHLHSKKATPTHSWWLNPHAKLPLRTALAKLDRYLATPLVVGIPAWDWIDSNQLPTAVLLAVARDDDFAHGILQSRFFNSWWRAWSPQLSPREIVETFPFPWPPATLLSALSRTQEEHRLAVARAARSGAQEQLDAAVAAAYGLADDPTDEEIVMQLGKLNQQRASIA
jgi:hypothetical protein